MNNILLLGKNRWRWFFTNANYMTICKFLTIDIFHVKLFRFWLSIARIVLVILCLIQAYFFLEKFDLDYLVHYSTMYYTVVYTTVCSLYQPLAESIATTNIPKLKILRFEDANLEIQKKVKKTVFWITVFMIGTLTSGLLITVAFWFPTDDDYDLLFYIPLLQKFFGKWSKIPILGFQLSIPVVAYISIGTPLFTSLYTIAEMELQRRMLIYHIRDLNSMEDLVNHENITKKLRHLIVVHIQFSKHMHEALRRAEIFVFPLYIVGTIEMANVALFYFAFEGSISAQYFRILTLALVAFATLGGFVLSGQIIENMSEEILEELHEVKWYHWNEGNKRLYLIFLMNAAPTFKIKFSENISVNYQLALAVIRAFFSTLSILYNLKLK